MKKITIILGLFLAAALLLKCGSPRRSAILYSGERELTDETLIHGRQIFAEHCQQCHPNGSEGLGPALNNKPLPGFLLRLQIRNGLGAMPAFSEKIISDEELDALVAYVDYLSDLPPPEE